MPYVYGYSFRPLKHEKEENCKEMSSIIYQGRLGSFIRNTHTYTHTHTHIYIMYLCFTYFIQYREWWKTFQGFQGNEWFMLFINVCCSCLVAQSCPALCNPMDCSPPGSSVQGISQARIVEWVAISFSRGSSAPRHQTHISCFGRQVLCHWVTREA